MTTLKVDDLRKAITPGRLADGNGLFLNIAKGGSKSWIQRIRIDGRRLDKGLGSFPAVTLTQARKLAEANRAAVAAGNNPWSTKERETASIKPEGRARRKTLTFSEVARLVHGEYARQLDSEKNARNWIQTLERHIFPVIGDTPITEIGRAEVLAALKPIWWTLPDAARRIRLRVRRVLDWAVENDLIEVNPERSLTKVSLPPQTKVMEHRRALPYGEVADALRKVEDSQAWEASKLCFTFMVLTASRPQEARRAQWKEIDLVAGVWTIDGPKMKERKEHRVPLAQQALTLLRRARELHRTPDDHPDWPVTVDPDAYIFPHPTTGAPLSAAALEHRAIKCGIAAVPHGFRSSFRDWAEEQTDAKHAAIELSLAHAVGNQVERAYRRTDLLGPRRELMEQWAAFVSPSVSPF